MCIEKFNVDGSKISSALDARDNNNNLATTTIITNNNNNAKKINVIILAVEIYNS
ncbi:MAG: hypothetical protein ICV56_09785 [Nitrososphaeraceae archaeon]|nr:hypothetical protein [Nitrososphaeraceae archaeon]